MEMKALDPLDDISFELQGDDSQTARVLAPTDGEEGIQRGRLIQPSRFRIGVMQGKRPPQTTQQFASRSNTRFRMLPDTLRLVVSPFQ